MRWPATLCALLAIPALAVCAASSGCAHLDDDDLLDPSGSGLQGNWEYLVNNAYESSFTGCTGDAAILEGLTFVDGMAAAPICIHSVYFEVLQDGDEFTVLPYSVACSDGSTASMTGVGSVSGATLSGEWRSTSDQGVDATQSFSGSLRGDVIEILETTRTFSGSFQGTCDLSPALSAIAEVH